ncbi:MAG: hypothetical protein U0Q21_16330 [Dermatophilaceae bacterium]
MPKAITIRNVPDVAVRELAARAARDGRSMQEYLRGELIQLANRPDRAMWVERVRARKAEEPVELTVEEILDAIHADRK